MRIVVFNAGSSSLKFGVFDHQGAATVQVFKGAFERFRDGGCQARFEAGTRRRSGAAPYPDLAAATAAVPGFWRTGVWTGWTPSATGSLMAARISRSPPCWTTRRWRGSKP